MYGFQYRLNYGMEDGFSRDIAKRQKSTTLQGSAVSWLSNDHLVAQEWGWHEIPDPYAAGCPPTAAQLRDRPAVAGWSHRLRRSIPHAGTGRAQSVHGSGRIHSKIDQSHAWRRTICHGLKAAVNRDGSCNLEHFSGGTSRGHANQTRTGGHDQRLSGLNHRWFGETHH